MTQIREQGVSSKEPRITVTYPIQLRAGESLYTQYLYDLPTTPEQAGQYMGYAMDALLSVFDNVPGRSIPFNGETPTISEVPTVAEAFEYFRGLEWQTTGMEFPPSGHVTTTLIGKENDATSKFTRAEISLNENRQLTYVRVETLDGNKDASHGFIYDPNSKNPGIDVYAPPQYHQYLGYFGPTPQGQRYLVQKTIQ